MKLPDVENAESIVAIVAITIIALCILGTIVVSLVLSTLP